MLSKHVIAAVEGDGDCPLVGMVINLVRTAPAIKFKPVSDKSGNDFASGSIP
jgi:hypothetical protein